MKKISEAESLLNEAIGEKPKRELKKEANENLRAFSLKSLSVRQLEQALDNNEDMSDNILKSGKFLKAIVGRRGLNFIYKVEFGGDDWNIEEGDTFIIVYIDDDGRVAADFYN
jgi:hypothetical protein